MTALGTNNKQPTEKRQDVVAVVLKGYPRLSETFIAQELRGLERLGFKLQFISLRHPTDKARHPIHEEIEASVNYLPEYLHHEPLRVLKGLARSATRAGFGRAISRFAKDLARDFTLNRFRRFGQACVMAAELPDDVGRLYAHFIHTPAAVTGYASLITAKPWSCSAHAKDIWTSPDWELAQNLKSTDWVATCTRVGWQHLRGLSADPAKVHLIYHGLDLSRFAAPTRRDEPARDGRDQNAPIRLLSVGRAVEKKGFDVLLAALALLPSDFHWTWTHIGGGPQLNALQSQAAELALGDRLTWLGAQPQADVLAAYRQTDIFVLPCRIAADGDRDGLPNVLVEAQSQRLACISTPISGIPELIIDGETGCLVPPDNAAALSAAIIELGSNVENRNQLANAGEARVRSAFDMDQGLKQLAALFAEPPENPQGHQAAQPISPEQHHLPAAQ